MFSPKLSQEEKRRRQEMFLSLPKDLKETILSEDTADKLYNISWGKYKLKDEQQRIVSFTAGEVMLGIVNLNEFADVFQKRLEIEQAMAEKIAQDIKQEVFLPVMESLNKIQQKSSQEPALKSIIPKSPTTSKPPKPKDERVVDLKNLSNK